MKLMVILFFICLGVVFYTYIGYGIILYVMVKIKEAVRKPKKKDIPEDLPEVTLFIAAYNEESVVAEKMKNTLALDYPKDKLKITWITDGSNDSTNQRLALFGNVKVLFQPQRQGKTSALNRGIEFVTTPIVIFTDANTMINSDAIREIVRCFSDEKVGCVAGEKRIEVRTEDGAAAGGEGLYWKYESALKSMDSRLCTAVGAAGELFAVRTALFEKMESDTLLDDFILSLRIAMQGYKIEYCDAAYAIESGSADMKEEEKRKVRIAAGGLQSIWRLRSLFNIFKYGMLSFQYVSHRVLRWSITPILMFLMLPLNVAIVMADPEYTPLYVVLLALQIAFYTMGIWGYNLSKKAIKNKFLYIPYYFLFMNINVIKGFFYLYNKKGSGVWEKAKRA